MARISPHLSARPWVATRTRHRAATTAIVFALLGIISILSSSVLKDGSAFQIFLRVLGSSFIASVAIGLAVNWALKPTLIEELLDYFRISGALHACGITSASVEYYGTEIPWKELFASGNSLTLFFTYAKHWRDAHANDLVEFVSKPGATLTVFLPNYMNQALVAVLNNQRRDDAGDIKTQIEKMAEYYTELKTRQGAMIEVILINRVPSLAVYQFANDAVVTLQPNAKSKKAVPTFVVHKSGLIYKYLEQEFLDLRSEMSA